MKSKATGSGGAGAERVSGYEEGAIVLGLPA